MAMVPMRVGELVLGLDVPPDAFGWLHEVFAGAATDVAEPVTSAVRVEARIQDPLRPRGGPPRERALLIRDGQPLLSPVWTDEHGGGTVFDHVVIGPAGVTWNHDRTLVTVRAPDPVALRATLFEVVRELVMVAHVGTGLTLHAAAVHRGGPTLVIAGSRRSGKTSLAAHLAGRGGTVVSNDRVLLTAAASGGVRVIGLPTIVSVRPGTVERLGLDLPWSATAWQCYRARQEVPDLAAPADEDYRWTLSLPQFADAIGAALGPATDRSVLVFPHIDADEQAFRVEPMSVAEAREEVRDQVLGSPGRRVSEVFTTRGADAIEPTVRSMVDRLVRAVPSVRLHLGDRWHKTSPSALSSTIVDHVPRCSGTGGASR